MSISNYHQQFYCPQEQTSMFDTIKESNPQLFDNILKAVETKKRNMMERDVVVTIFFSHDERKCPVTCSPEQFKLIKSFNAPQTSTCPSIHSGMCGGWITENVFLVGCSG